MWYTFCFGCYLNFFFVKTKHIEGSIFLHGYCNFFGHPDIINLFKRDYNDQTSKSTLSKYYFNSFVVFFYFGFDFLSTIKLLIKY